MARKRGKKASRNTNEASVKDFKKQGGGSDLKPTRCSKCRFAKDPKTGNTCYQRAGIRPELEYVDCVPALIHYSDKKLSALNLI